MKKEIIIITGISSGIGFYLANYLSEEGHIIYGILRNKEKFYKNLEENKITKKDNLELVQMDVRDYNEAEKLINTITNKHQKIDILINNAGYGLYGVFEELNDKDIRDQFETNFFAPLKWIQMVLPFMRKNNYGKILNITSILGRLTIPTGSAYCSSKHALVALSEVIRYEVAPFNIQVCSVEPGLIKTDFKNNMKFSTDLDNKNSPYYKLNQKIKEQLTKYPSIVTTADAAAKKIQLLLKKENLPAHFQIGIDAGFYYNLKTILPEGFLDFLIKEYTKRVFR
ncbi:MAG: short-chain dehydrogenase/reductase [Leptospiraceae bacterium]|nr:MAG: short-chain dehydrogenase/reductase [Leptospiraceae bacterium]GIX43547.1 MAG: short-chain dehydrogenase/reductase [Leptospiraceae bacterium]